MEFKDIVAISGKGGLFEVVAKRSDGMIVRGLDEEKSAFVSSRLHVFTPLDAITIYTTGNDTTELRKVLLEMKSQEKKNSPVDANASNDELKSYFKKVLPDYDEERVYVSDIKKVLKWYQQLSKYDLVKEEVIEEKKTEEKEEPIKEATTDKKPKTAAKAKKAASVKATKPSAPKNVPQKRITTSAKRGG